ncbi:hypothetical protein [Bacteroides acidifaciens]|uniref:hypothetical protein n=1 Tax=Bacteroides acidifaciens TaxID=85831 RepID=UPI003F694BAC
MAGRFDNLISRRDNVRLPYDFQRINQKQSAVQLSRMQDWRSDFTLGGVRHLLVCWLLDSRKGYDAL